MRASLRPDIRVRAVADLRGGGLGVWIPPPLRHSAVIHILVSKQLKCFFKYYFVVLFFFFFF